MTTGENLQAAENRSYLVLVKQAAYPAALYLTAFTIPFPIMVNNISVFLLIIAWLFTTKKSWSFFRNITLITSSLLLFYLWHLIGIGYSSNTKAAVQLALETNASYAIFPIILFSSSVSRLPLKGILWAFVAGFLLVTFVSVIEILLKIIENGEPVFRLVSYYTRWNFIENTSLSYHAPYMGFHAALCFAILLHYFDVSSLIKVSLQVSTLLFMLLVIYLLGSKLPLIVVTLASVYYLTHFSLKHLLSFKVINSSFTVVLVLLAIIFYFNRESVAATLEQHIDQESLYWGSLPNRFIKLLKTGDQDRSDNWHAAICAYKKNILVGAGVGDGLDSLQSCRQTTSWNYIQQVNAHNQYLEVAVRSGTVGLLLFLAGIFFSLILANRSKDQLYFFFMVSLIISLTFENFMDRQKGIILIAFLNSLFLYQYKLRERVRQKL